MAFQRGPNIVTNGLVLALDAGNPKSYVSGSTIWYDKSGYNYTGSLVNEPTFSNANGGSIIFDGTNDYIAPSNYIPFYRPFMTYEIVFKPISNTSQGPLGGSDVIGTIPYFYLDYANGNIRTYHAGTPGFFTVKSLPLGSIYHFVCVRSSTQEYNYVNSIPALGRSLNSLGGNINGFGSVGGWAGGLNWYFNGNIYIIRIYNRALSAQEVLQNYNAQKSRFEI